MTGMTAKAYRKLTEEQMVGLHVESLVELRNGTHVVAAGTEFTIERKWAGLGLRSLPCEHCGVQVRISKVPPDYVKVVPA